MTTMLFEKAKSVPFLDILKVNGVVMTDRGTCLCPFHSDTKPSMKIYKDHAYCFACNTRADGVKMVAQIYNLSPVEAAKKILVDFGLSDKSSEEERKLFIEKVRQREETEKAKNYAKALVNVGYRLLWALNEWSEIDDKSFEDEKLLCGLRYAAVLEDLLNEAAEAEHLGEDLSNWIKSSGAETTIKTLNREMGRIAKERNL